MRPVPSKLYCAFIPLIIIFFMSGCTPGNNDPKAWINYPRDGTIIEDIKPLQVVAHASDSRGVAYAVLGVNGVSYEQQNPDEAGAEFAEFTFNWRPPGEGDYTLSLIAYDSGGKTRSKATSRVHIGKIITETPTPSATPEFTATFTPTPTLTATPTPLPEIHAKLIADRSSINSGECVLLSWWAENAERVTLDDVEVDLTGSGSYCPAVTHTYLLVASRGEERVEERMAITVNEAGDTTPPSVPQPMVPSNGLHIACKANQTLAWLPVQDPSGLLGYDVVLERKVGGSWNSYRSWDRLSDKQISASVECGYEYRWRVRAVDTAGNASAWSGWFTFAIDLS